MNTLKTYIRARIQILKDMKIWKKLTEAEQDAFALAESKYKVDCLMVDFRNKYL